MLKWCKMPRFSNVNVPKLWAIALCLSMITCNTLADEQPQWWFDVEVILFKRVNTTVNNEQFATLDFSQQLNDANNLLWQGQIRQQYPLQPLQFTLPECDVPPPRIISKADEFASYQEITQQINDIESQLSDIEKAISEPVPEPIEPVFENEEEAEAREVFEKLLAQAKEYQQELQQLANIQISLDCLGFAKRDWTPIIDRIDKTLVSTNSEFTGSLQLLTVEDFRLAELASKVFAQRNIKPLLHTAWRENIPFGEQNAEFMRIRAGQLLSTNNELSYEQLDEQWLKLNQESAEVDEITQTDNNEFFTELERALEQNLPIDWQSELPQTQEQVSEEQQPPVFELDGLFKVYLDYVNGVPYLHIDSEFMFNQLMLNSDNQEQIKSSPFKQRRRIISKQIHYFDHPDFGMIIRLERFKPPVVEEADQEQDL